MPGPPSPWNRKGNDIEEGSERPQSRSRPWWVLAGACGGVACWVLLTGGVRILSDGEVWFSLTRAQRPLVLAALFGVIAWWTDPLRNRPLRSAVASLWERLVVASAIRRLGMLLTGLLLVVQITLWLAAPDGLRDARRAEPELLEGLVSDHGMHDHLPALLAEITTVGSGAPVVVYIDGVDSRGHVASFYAFPRLLMMEPKRRVWTLREAMRWDFEKDPGFGPLGPPPPRASSLRYAARRGVDHVAVGPDPNVSSRVRAAP